MKRILLFIMILVLFASWKKDKPKQLSRNQITLTYIEKFKKTAIEEHRRFCIPASITLAQGILESASGQSILVRRTNNHFGIKCFGKCNNRNSVMMADDNPYDRFLKYKSAWYSFRHHSKFLIENTRYRKCFECGDSYRCWARQLKRCGYATSKTYAQKLIKIIETYKLYKYDR